MTLANYVTLSRIVLIPLVIAFLYVKIDGLAVMLFLLLSFSDAVDGYIARRFNQVSDLGKYLDPLADKILVICVLIVLVELGKVSAIPVIILAAREFAVQGIRINAASHKKSVAASPVAKWKTATQIAAIAMLMLRLPYAAHVLWLSVVLALISGGAYFWQGKR